MAVAAFKSSSRRGNLASPSKTSSSGKERESMEDTPKKAPIRRSRSVSAVSRSSLEISTEFVNKRDNPLFWSSTSPKDDEIESTKTIEKTKLYEVTPSSESSKAKSAGPVNGFGRRGRSTTRNGEVGSNKGPISRKETGRSLSRVDPGRRNRSASQCPVSRRHFSTSESEAEQDCNFRKSKAGNNNVNLVGTNRKAGLSRTNSGVLDPMKNLRTWSTQHSSPEASDCFATTLSRLRTQNYDDAISTASSASGYEEKTIKAVHEQMELVQAGQLEANGIYETVRSEVRRAISEIQNDLVSPVRRSNATAIGATDLADIASDLVNPGAVELVLDITREYGKKLEESQERARKLRADLAVEELREQELDRILKEVLLYPKTPNVQKSRPSRKNSIERRRMSKRLTEDAMAYFDECVSLSTFDSSDLSSQEDPSLSLDGPSTRAGSRVCLPEASPEGIISNFITNFLPDEQESTGPQESMNNHLGNSQPSASVGMESIQDQIGSTIGSPESGRRFQFSFAQKPFETSELQQDIQHFIKKLDEKCTTIQTVSSNYCDLDAYSYQPSAENLLTDRVLLRNRIQSGSLLLCSGGITFPSKFCGLGI
ncbi:hypothetical protein L6164_017730 [Bauhinia variegata]|uniref:Uncharacterized protein n=1 Tax=Bauhinia variegata TaxID=167791 RepID=A0ACB9NAC0_BAUVA|nr:hypothetical protein L6164_017730 [Bauhinia variegata]